MENCEKKDFLVEDLDSFYAKLKQVKEAQKKFAEYSQKQVDEIFRAAAIAANTACKNGC